MIRKIQFSVSESHRTKNLVFGNFCSVYHWHKAHNVWESFHSDPKAPIYKNSKFVNVYLLQAGLKVNQLIGESGLPYFTCNSSLNMEFP